MRKLNSPEQDPSREVPLGGKILYVEDNEENRRVCEFRLKRQFHVVLAADDREACARVQEHGRSLTAILMDIELQGSALNGIELAQLFRGHPTRGRRADLQAGQFHRAFQHPRPPEHIPRSAILPLTAKATRT